MKLEEYRRIELLINTGLYSIFQSIRNLENRLRYDLEYYHNSDVDLIYSRIEYLRSFITDEDYSLMDRFRKSNSARISRVKARITRILKSDCEYKLFLTFTFKDSVFDKTDMDTRRTYIRRFLKKYCVDYVANIDFGFKPYRKKMEDEENSSCSVGGPLQHIKALGWRTKKNCLCKLAAESGVVRGEYILPSEKILKKSLTRLCPLGCVINTHREHYHAVVCCNDKLFFKNWKYGSLNFKRIRIFNNSILRLSKYIDKLVSHSNKNLCKCYQLIYARNVQVSKINYIPVPFETSPFD